MRAIFTALFLSLFLLACDTQNSAIPVNQSPSTSDGFAFDDEFGTAAATDSLLRVHSRIVGTSPDGSEADLLLTFTLDPYIRNALRASSYVQFDYVVQGSEDRLLGRQKINDELGGSLEVSVPTQDDTGKLVASVGGLLPDVIENQSTLVTQMPAILKRETTDLSRVAQVEAELVDGSYESQIINGRRVHRFAIKVTDPTAAPISELLDGTEDLAKLNYSISGLEQNASAHFTALENDIVDNESPVTVSFTEHPLAVYLVIDTSKSIVDSRQVHHLTSAVSNSVIALTQNANFDYRVFNGQVKRIGGIRELDFDSGDSSATALYYALDTALSDIENFGSISQDKVVMVFTDGRDLASRNHYPGFIDNEQVHEHIVQRVDQVRKAQKSTLGRQLDVYTIGFYDEASGLDVSEEVKKLDKISAVGGTEQSYNNFNAQDIDDAFAAVVHNIRGVYYLQYSSQQTPDNNKLELLVNVNGHEARVQLPTEYQSTQD